MKLSQPSNPLAHLLEKQAYIILDGALATELEKRGANLDDPLWSARLLIEQPHLIRQVHADYFKAGADIAITASYQASYPGFAARGISQQEATQLLRHSVDLAATARAEFWATCPDKETRPYPLIAASIGPYGAFLADGSEYRGNYGLPKAELITFHRPRMQTLASSAADLLACETIPCAVEAAALVDLLAEQAQIEPAMPPAWISFACRNGEELNSGDEFKNAVELAAHSPHVVAIGVNCTAPIYITELLQNARSVTQKPLLVYPNQGEVWDSSARRWVTQPAAPCIVDYVESWCAAGATGIGGCCRTDPEDIRRIAAKLRNRARQ